MNPKPRAQSPDNDLHQSQQQAWPRGTRYFVPGIHDANSALRFLDKDTSFNPTVQDFRCVDFVNPGTASSNYLIDVADTGALASLDSSNLPPGSGHALFIPQRREYFERSTCSHISLPRSTWHHILGCCAIPTTALELLHDNNGGRFQHVSHCDDNIQAPCTSTNPSHDLATCAYHVFFKLCKWGGGEHFFLCEVRLPLGDQLRPSRGHIGRDPSARTV